MRNGGRALDSQFGSNASVILVSLSEDRRENVIEIQAFQSAVGEGDSTARAIEAVSFNDQPVLARHQRNTPKVMHRSREFAGILSRSDNRPDCVRFCCRW